MEGQNKILIFIKYEYLSRYGEPNEELYDITATNQTTIKDLKDEINKSFIYGELNNDQYEIYKCGEQQNHKEKTREAMTYYYKYNEPQFLDDDNKTIKDYNIIDYETLHLKAKLKIFLYIPTMRYTTVYVYTNDTLKILKIKLLKFLNQKMKY